MVQYYTLEQAAQILRTTPDKLKEMAKKNEVRAFQDPKGLRFRAQEIDELARARGYGSDSEMPTGQAKPVSPRPTPQDPGVFDFELGGDDSDEVPIGQQEPRTPGKSTSRSSPGTHSPSPGRKSSLPKSGGPKSPGPRPSSKSQLGKSPPPKPASDSDVRLVMEGSDLDFHIEVDSDVKVGKDPASGPSPPPAGKSKMGPGQAPGSGSRVVPQEKPSDSDIKMVPSDDDVALGRQGAKSPSDSDIRIEQQGTPVKTGLHGGPVRHPEIVTEEIDLDAEARKAEAAKPAAPSRSRPAGPVLPTSSPFELSEHDLDVGAPPPAPEPPEPPGAPAAEDTDSSSDFELSVDVGSSPIELGSDEVPVLMNSDDEVTLGELSGGGGASGINLQDPVDSGISLEAGGSDEIEFELSLEGGSTPKPAKGPAADDESGSSSEFELSLDEAAPPAGEQESDSEFELNLDVEGSSESIEAPKADSDSEFELTLDESGGLSLEEGAAPQEEQDIFETDFDVPAMDEESGSEAVALDEADTDLEGSEFDLSLEEQGEESGSEVMPLEESLEDSSEVAEDEEGLSEEFGEDLDRDLDREPELEAEEEEEEEVAPAAAAVAAPAPWGVVPALFLIPSVLVLFVVGLMSFELLQGMWGYHKPSKVSNLIIQPLAKQFDDSVPAD
jgi:hypothetical protein